MIFVTVGTSGYGFERLIKKMDEISGKTNEEIILQIGSTDYKPKNAEYFRLISRQKMEDLYKKARVVVCHGGAGTIINVLEQGIPVIAVPRLKKYGEHIDDQQLDIVNAMVENGKIIAVYDVDELEGALNSVGENPVHVGSERMRLVSALKEYIGG